MGRGQEGRVKEMKNLLIALILLVLASSSYSSTQATDEAFRSQQNGSRPNMAFTDKTKDEVLQKLITDYADKFTIETYSDDVTGLSIQYNLYLPEGYNTNTKYPLIVFIGDASCAGKAPEFSIKQGYGALSWFDRNAVVIVPTYPGVVLDDHDGFILTDYVELTGRLIRWAKGHYGASETYGTGQSMGCMTSLVLAAKYPDLYTACLFVSGQWDVNTLAGLVGQKFVYVASMGDSKASAGQHEVIEMFRKDDVNFVLFSGVDARNPDINITPTQPANFITFKTGTTLPEGASEGASEHMTSFDYAYKIKALRDWLFAQKED